jgi:hypothetical protein
MPKLMHLGMATWKAVLFLSWKSRVFAMEHL